MPTKTKPRSSAMLSSTTEFERLLKRRHHRGRYLLRLYVTGTTPRSAQAITNIRSLCDEYLVGNYDLEVIDIYQQPTQAIGEQIVAAPTLIKKLPTPVRRMVGDLSNRDRVLLGLDLPSKGTRASPSETKWVEL